jgi:hypothetical protein
MFCTCVVGASQVSMIGLCSILAMKSPGEGVGVDGEVLLVEADVLAGPRIFPALVATSIGPQPKLGFPCDDRVEEGSDAGRVIAFGAELRRRLEKVDPPLLGGEGVHGGDQVDVHHVDVGVHDVLDLALEEGNGAVPGGAAFDGSPGAVELAGG